MPERIQRPPPPTLMRILAVPVLAVFVAVGLLELRAAIPAPYSRNLHIEDPRAIAVISALVAAGLWWVILGLRQYRPPLPLLRPTRARLIGWIALWSFCPVGFGLGIPIINLYVWGFTLPKEGVGEDLARFAPVSGVTLVLTYLLACTLISLTRRGWHRVLAFVLAALAQVWVIYMVLGSSGL